MPKTWHTIYTRLPDEEFTPMHKHRIRQEFGSDAAFVRHCVNKEVKRLGNVAKRREEKVTGND